MDLTVRQRRSLRRGVLVPSWVGIGGLALASSFGASIPTRYRYLPLIASVVLLGLPHGAVDHLAVPRSRGEPISIEWFGLVGALYLLLGLAYAVAWFLVPVASVVFFVLLTWFHWGQGDVWPLVSILDADHLHSRPLRVATVLVRGGLPMLAPLWFFPNRYRAVVAEIVGRFGVAPDALEFLFRSRNRAAIVGGLAALSVLALLAGLVATADRRAWLLDAGEVALLWWYFAVVPPVLAIGIYFPLWHSLRHVGRLAALDPRGADALATGRLGTALGRFARDAAPLTALSIALLGGFYFALPNPPTDVPGFVAAYLAFIAILTLPHVVVVTAMDLEAGVWGGLR